MSSFPTVLCYFGFSQFLFVLVHFIHVKKSSKLIPLASGGTSSSTLGSISGKRSKMPVPKFLLMERIILSLNPFPSLMWYPPLRRAESSKVQSAIHLWFRGRASLPHQQGPFQGEPRRRGDEGCLHSRHSTSILPVSKCLGTHGSLLVSRLTQDGWRSCPW